MNFWLLFSALSVPATWADTPGRGGGCNAVCTVEQAPKLSLTDGELADLLLAWSREDMTAPSMALETLLFHGSSTLALLDGHDLPPERRRFLQHELSRNQVMLEMRLVDDSGTVRGTLKPTVVNLVEKQHLSFEGTGSLGGLITGGKVKRVGLNHVWSRW